MYLQFNMIDVVACVKASRLDYLSESIILSYLENVANDRAGVAFSNVYSLDLSKCADGSFELCFHLKTGAAFTVTFNV